MNCTLCLCNYRGEEINRDGMSANAKVPVMCWTTLHQTGAAGRGDIYDDVIFRTLIYILKMLFPIVYDILRAFAAYGMPWVLLSSDKSGFVKTNKLVWLKRILNWRRIQHATVVKFCNVITSLIEAGSQSLANIRCQEVLRHSWVNGISTITLATDMAESPTQ